MNEKEKHIKIGYPVVVIILMFTVVLLVMWIFSVIMMFNKSMDKGKWGKKDSTAFLRWREEQDRNKKVIKGIDEQKLAKKNLEEREESKEQKIEDIEVKENEDFEIPGEEAELKKSKILSKEPYSKKSTGVRSCSSLQALQFKRIPNKSSTKFLVLNANLSSASSFKQQEEGKLELSKKSGIEK